MILRHNEEILELQNIQKARQAALAKKKSSLTNGTIRTAKPIPILGNLKSNRDDTPFDTPEDHHTVKTNASFTNKTASDSTTADPVLTQKVQSAISSDANPTQGSKAQQPSDPKAGITSPKNGLQSEKTQQGFPAADINSRKPPTPNNLSHFNTNKGGIQPSMKNFFPTASQNSEQWRKQDIPVIKRPPSCDNMLLDSKDNNQPLAQAGVQHQSTANDNLSKDLNFKGDLNQFNSAPSKLQDKSGITVQVNSGAPIQGNGGTGVLGNSGHNCLANKGMNIQTTSPLRDHNGTINTQKDILSPTEIALRKELEFVYPNGKKYSSAAIESLKVIYSFNK